jgi:hypothetical protein
LREGGWRIETGGGGAYHDPMGELGLP